MLKRMYFLLFRQITEAIKLLERGDAGEAREVLIRAQQDAEELYMEGQEQ